MGDGRTHRRLTVDAAHDGARLDRFLAARLPDLSRSRLHGLIADGLVLVGGGPRKPSARVHRGEEVVVTIPPRPPAETGPETIPLDVRYEDDDVLVVNKPPGLPVHPGPGHPGGTLANAILARLPHLAAVGEPSRPGIVHRLDKDTSGLLVLAKTEAALAGLQAQIKARTAARTYLAIVHGRPAVPVGTIDAPIGRHPRRRRMMAVAATGRPAVTRYRLVEQLGRPGVGEAALVEARLLTGRTHQIRVHFAYLGHPVVGDPIYGRRRETWGMRRQALHAFRLAFAHPRTGAAVEVEAPMPEDMAEALRRLREATAP